MSAQQGEDGLVLVDLPPPIRRTLAAQAAQHPGLQEEVYASSLLCAAIDAAGRMANDTVAEAPERQPEPAANESPGEEDPALRMQKMAVALKECNQLTSALLAEFRAYGFNTSEANLDSFYVFIDHLCGEKGLSIAQAALERLGYVHAPPQAAAEDTDGGEAEGTEQGSSPQKVEDEGQEPPTTTLTDQVLEFLKAFPEGGTPHEIAYATDLETSQVRWVLSSLNKTGRAHKVDDHWVWTGRDDGIPSPRSHFQDSGAIQALQRMCEAGSDHCFGSTLADEIGRSAHSMSMLLRALEREGILSRDGKFEGAVRWRIHPEELAEWLAKVEPEPQSEPEPVVEVEVEAPVEDEAPEPPVKIKTADEFLADFEASFAEIPVVKIKTADEFIAELERKRTLEKAGKSADPVMDAAMAAFGPEPEPETADEVLPEWGRRTSKASESQTSDEALATEKIADPVMEAAELAFAFPEEEGIESVKVPVEPTEVVLEEFRWKMEQGESSSLLDDDDGGTDSDEEESSESLETEDTNEVSAEIALARFKELVATYNSTFESLGSRDKAQMEHEIRFNAPAEFKQKAGWLADHLQTNGTVLDFTIRHKARNLGALAIPIWAALDEGMSYKRAKKVLLRFKRVIKRKGVSPADYPSLMQKSIADVLNGKTMTPPAPESSPALAPPTEPKPVREEEPEGAEEAKSKTAQQIVDGLVGAGMPLSGTGFRLRALQDKALTKQAQQLFLKTNGTAAIYAAGKPVPERLRTPEEVVVDARLLASNSKEATIRQAIVKLYVMVNNAPMTIRRLTEGIVLMMPKVHHPSVVAERTHMVREGLMVHCPDLGKGFYALAEDIAALIIGRVAQIHAAKTAKTISETAK
jgi:hypothetical protein